MVLKIKKIKWLRGESFTSFSQQVVLLLLLTLPLTSVLASTFLNTSLSDIVQQNKTVRISGTVVSEGDNGPIIGANIKEVGTTNGTISDIEGKFTLSVNPESTLEISFIGYVKQVIKVTNSTLHIIMKEDARQLNEVVVTGFGLAQKKATLTGAISSVGSDDIARSSAVTTSGALAGKIAGINVRQADGRPGNGVSVQIRNMGTPLYVIDGVIKDEGQFNNIDFNDIESISILKDASAAIYGMRAANGVVVVTTKKGQLNQKNIVSVNTYYGWQNLSSFPKPADAVTYITNYIQSETLQGVQDQNRKYTREDLAKWTEGKEKGYVPFDWYHYIWKTAPQYYIGISTSGGSDKINYYLAVSHIDQDAMIRNYGGFRRTNVQMNVDANITKRFKVGASLNGRIETRENPGVPGGDDYWAPIFATYRNLPTKRPFANDNPKYPALTSNDASTNFGMLNYKLSGKYRNVWRVAQLNFNAEYQLFDGLKLKGLLGYYLAQQWLDNQEYTYTLYDYDPKTDTYPIAFQNLNPWRERNIQNVEELTTNFQLSYDKKFGVHSINAVLGAETIKRDTPNFWIHSIPEANSIHLIDFSTLKEFNDYGNNTEARIGYLGRISYNYNEKYLLDLSARYDGSWKFPPSHRWGFFPSVSVGWRISQEGFWQESSYLNKISDLKIRASYGLVGDDNVSGYSAFDYMKGYNFKNGGSVIDNSYTIGTVPRGLAVTNLSWIKAKMLDIGLDYGFFDHKLLGTVDYFRRIRTGLPASRYDVLIPSEAGFSLPNENLNSDVVKGYDLGLKWNSNVGDLKYSIGANVTYSRLFDWQQYKPRFGNSWDYYRNSINERFSNITWGYEAIGQFQNWEQISSYPVDIDGKGNTTLRPGDIIYKDVNGDKTINGLDERPLGYKQGGTPTFNYGLNFAFNYKDISLSFDLTGGALNTWNQDWEQRLPFHDGGNNPQYYLSDTWRLSDIWNANSTLIPGKYPTPLVGNSGHSDYWSSSFWYHNVSYIKLRNLELSYTVPTKLLSKVNISNLRVYLLAQNLFMISNTHLVMDPEIDSSNALQYPTTRVFNLGLTLKF